MNPEELATFFIIYPVGLEDLGRIELEEKYAVLETSAALVVKMMIPGGIEIECPLLAGLKLNFVLKTPTRILLRLAEFKCRDFPKLFQKMSKFNWAPWMLGQTPSVECTSKNSRLFDSRKIEKAIQDGINQFYRHKPVKKKYLDHFAVHEKNESLPAIYFRSEDDLVTLSIDTTGERLHRRGEKPQAGLAPIRENLASLLITELKKHVDQQMFTLIDPMCGSGTFIIEAAKYYTPVTSRDFAFRHFPVTIEAPALFHEVKAVEKNPIVKTVGLDISKDVIAQAMKNNPDGEYIVEDLMKKNHHDFENAVVIINPPYGIRVGENINLDFYLRVIRSVREKFSPIVMGIIIPDDFKIYSNNEWNVLKARPFKNGGLDVTFYVLKYT
jgi:putative N6-adenine-specific DNA methylase